MIVAARRESDAAWDGEDDLEGDARGRDCASTPAANRLRADRENAITVVLVLSEIDHVRVHRDQAAEPAIIRGVNGY
jgi:hypothetical protein